MLFAYTGQVLMATMCIDQRILQLFNFVTSVGSVYGDYIDKVWNVQVSG